MSPLKIIVTPFQEIFLVPSPDTGEPPAVAQIFDLGIPTEQALETARLFQHASAMRDALIDLVALAQGIGDEEELLHTARNLLAATTGKMRGASSTRDVLKCEASHD